MFPFKACRQTQGINVGSHKGTYAIDYTYIGNDRNVYAPFTGKIVYIGPYEDGHPIILQSMEPVECADGKVDYVCVLTGHANDVSNLKVGQIIYQGAVYSKMGDAGNATGVHTHLEVALGKWAGYLKNSDGNWLMKNEVIPNSVLFITPNTIIENSTYQYKVTTEPSTLSFTIFELLGVTDTTVKFKWSCDVKVYGILSSLNDGPFKANIEGYPDGVIRGLTPGTHYTLKLKANAYYEKDTWGTSKTIEFTTTGNPPRPDPIEECEDTVEKQKKEIETLNAEIIDLKKQIEELKRDDKPNLIFIAPKSDIFFIHLDKGNKIYYLEQ